MNFEQARFNMIEQQIRPWEVLDPTVLATLGQLKREDFVPAAYRELAFADLELPIAAGQTMLAPRVEARFLQELALKKTDKVLEIGTGTGYMAALLAALTEHVVTVEINPELAATAKQNLANAGIDNVSIEIGDGAQGWSARGPYDVIVVSGSLPEVPPALLQQLRRGGRLAVVVGAAPVMTAEVITCTAEGVFNSIKVFETVIAPLANAKASPKFEF